jgi:hypothetical protein
MPQITNTTTTTTTTTTATQINQQLNVGTSTTNYNLGNYVTDVTLQPYIAPQVVSFVAYNMRPSANLHMFFDSQNVDAYCAPGFLNACTSVDTSMNSVVQQTAAYGTQIQSNANGAVYGVFNIPPNQFKTGDRVLEIADVTSIAQGNDAVTSSAFSTFTGGNISVTKQGITLTTINPQLSVANIVNSVVTTNVVSNTVSVTIPDGGVMVHLNPGYDPTAQVFTFSTPNSEVGGYVISLQLYFKQKSLTGNHGVTVYICETTVGYPDTSKILPFSTVHLDWASINTSDDSTTPTTFTFESPVFLNADTNYAFVVKPDANDPDLLIFTAALGDVDISTGGQVFSQPNAGTAFIGATTSAWTALQNEYVKFKLNRAAFSNNYGVAVFRNTPRDYIQINNIAYVNTSVSINAGDYVFQASNSYQNSIGGTATFSVNGAITYYNSNSNVLYVDNTAGNFGSATYVQIHRFANSLNLSPNNATLIASGNVVSLVNPKANAIVPQYSVITPSGTQARWAVKGTISNTYVGDANSFPINLDSETELFDYERMIASRSNEVSNLSGGSSLSISTQLISDSSYLSPLIDTVRSSALVISNQIDQLSSNIYDEMLNYGTVHTKYISQPVVLAPGQNAQDINVFVDAYRPYSSYVKVYVKFLSGEDQESLINKTWTPLVCDGDSLYSSYGNTKDVKEFKYLVPLGYGAFACNGSITVTSSCTVVTGTSTKFTSQLAVGRYINIKGDTARKIVSITSDNQLTISSAFTSNWSANAFYLVPPPTTAWMSTNTQSTIAGTVTANSGTNIITGSGTSFNTIFTPGMIIGLANDEQVIVSVTNATSLTVGTPWSSNVSGAAAYNISPAGISYLNSNNNLFIDYNKFQIKVVLMSDDSARVPLLTDVRAIALQV